MAHEGDCKVDLTTIPPAVGTICIGPDDCEKDQFCERKEGACDGEGVCAARPEFCMDLWKPVSVVHCKLPDRSLSLSPRL